MHILYTHCIGHHRLSHYIILYRGNRNLGRQLQVTYINNENSRHFVVGCEYWGFLFCTSDFYYFLLFLYIVARTHAQHLSRHLLRRGLARIPAKYYYYTLVYEGNNFFFEINYLRRCHYCYYDYYQVHILLPRYLAVCCIRTYIKITNNLFNF